MQAVYYRAPDGAEPVNDFIDRLDVGRQVALDNQMERLNMLTPDAPHLPYPHSSQVEGELRSSGATSGGSCIASSTGARET